MQKTGSFKKGVVCSLAERFHNNRETEEKGGRMPTYTFRYVAKRSASDGLVDARDDKDAGEKIKEFLVQKEGILIPCSIVLMVAARRVPDPAWVDPEWIASCSRPRAA